MNGDDVLKRLSAQRKEATQTIEVPEWGNDDGPFVAYYSPASPRNHSDAGKLAKAFGLEDSDFGITVAMLVVRLRNEKGERIFNDSALPELMEVADVKVVNRIVKEVQHGSQYSEGVEDAKKQ
nr:hypothetical protein 23 [Pseudomonadaceae bacterium]